MSKNIKKILQERLLPWLIKNSPDYMASIKLNPRDFWVVPIEASNPSYKELEANLSKKFQGTSDLQRTQIDHYKLQIINNCGSRCILICKADGSAINLDGNIPFRFEDIDLTFLQRIEFVTEFEIPAPLPIPHRVFTDAINKNESIFEGDLSPYLPAIVAWEVPDTSDFSGDSANVLFARTLINLDRDGSATRVIADHLIEFALSLPSENHDWLFEQLYFALTSKKPEYLYLGLYQLLEFFFPLKSVSKLKSKIGYAGSILELRALCSDSLGWNVNHNFGARAAAQYGNLDFAAVCLGRHLDPNDPQDKVVRIQPPGIDDIVKPVKSG